MSPITRETLAARIATLEAEKDISIKEAFYLKTMRLLLAEMDKPQPHHNGMMQLSNQLADAKAALIRLSTYARLWAGDIQYTGDHPIAVAEKLAGCQLSGNTEQLDTAPAQFESLAGEPVSQHYKLPVIGWVRTDYQDENRKGDAPLFIFGKKDPSAAWGVPYLRVGNYPEVPDSWVVCSERLPEDTDQVYLFTNGEVLKDAYYNAAAKLFYWEYCADTIKASDVSHWMHMTLPAAPQQGGNCG